MPGLRDIAALVETIELRGEFFPVRGFEIDALALALSRSSDLEKALVPGVKFDAMKIVEVMPALARELAAFALGAESEEDRAGAANLSAGEKMAVLTKAWDLTFPNGVGLPVLTALVGRFMPPVSAASGSDPATISS